MNELEQNRRIEKNILDFTEGTIIHIVNCYGEMDEGFSKELKRFYHSVYLQYRDLCFRNNPETLLGQVQIIYENDLVFVFLFAHGKKKNYKKPWKVDYKALKRALIRVNLAFVARHIWISCPLGQDEGVNGNRVERIFKENLMNCTYELFYDKVHGAHFSMKSDDLWEPSCSILC